MALEPLLSAQNQYKSIVLVDGYMLGNVFNGPKINFHAKPLDIRGIRCLISFDKPCHLKYEEQKLHKDVLKFYSNKMLTKLLAGCNLLPL